MRKRFVLLAALAGALMLFGTPQGAFAHGGGGSHGSGSQGAGRSGSSHSGGGQSASGRSGTHHSAGDRDDRRGGGHARHDRDRFDDGCCGYGYGYPYYYGYPYGYGYGYGNGYNDACSYSGDRGDCANNYGPSPRDQGQWDCRYDRYRDQNRYRQACRYYSDCTNYPRCRD